MHAGAGGPAGSVQPGPLPRSAAAPHDQRRRRTVGLRAGELGRGRGRPRRARPRPGRGGQRRPHCRGHPAAVGDAGHPGRPLGRRRRWSAQTAIRGVRLRAAAGGARDRLRPRLRPAPRLRPGGPDPVVRRRLSGDLAVDRQSFPRLRGCPPPRQRAHRARRSLRAPPLADRVERGRVGAYRAGDRRGGGRGDGADHRGGRAGAGDRDHRRRPGPHPRAGGRLDPGGGRRAERRAGRSHRPARAGVLGSGSRPGPDAGRGGRRRRLRTERHPDPGRRRAAQLRRGQRGCDRAVRIRRPVGQSLDRPRPARPRRGNARRRDRAADPASGQSGAHAARRRRLRRRAGRRALRRGDLELAGRDDGAGRPDSAGAHPAGVVGRPPPRCGPVRPDAADHAARVRHAPFRRHPARGRSHRARGSGRGGSRCAGRRTDPSRGRVLRGAAGRVARRQGRAGPAGRAGGRAGTGRRAGASGSRGRRAPQRRPGAQRPRPDRRRRPSSRGSGRTSSGRAAAGLRSSPNR